MLVPANLSVEKANKRITDALEIIYRFGQNDGAHHLQWTIDQVAQALLVENYEDWVADYEGDPDDDANFYNWDTGICP